MTSKIDEVVEAWIKDAKRPTYHDLLQIQQEHRQILFELIQIKERDAKYDSALKQFDALMSR